jgi:hypothetical protein
VPDLIGQIGNLAVDGRAPDEAQALRVARLAEQPLAVPEHDWVDLQPQLVGKVALDQCTRELEAGCDDDLAVELCFSLDTSPTASPRSSLELFQSRFSRLEDTTYLGMPFNLSANSPVRDGQRAANHS